MVKIGLIGCGKWGENHARVFSQIDCEFMGIADVNPETGEVAKKYGVRYEKNYKDLLPHVDAVSIVTPSNTHYQIVKDCLIEGKHVLVEKPLTLDAEKAKEIVELSDEKNLKLAVGHLFRFNPVVIKLKDIIKGVGELNYITMRFIHSHKPPRKDSGTIFNFASHLFDILNFVLDAQPKEMFCKKINFLSDEREDCALIFLDYGKFICSLEVSWFHPLKERDVWVIASKEKIHVDLLKQKMKKYSISIDAESTNNKGSEDIDITWDEPLKKELMHFCECIKENKTLINDGKSGYVVTKLCEDALESAKTGRRIIYENSIM